MDHAEVLERIEDAVASRGGLARLGSDPSPEAVEVRAHVVACPPCAAEWRAWSLVSLGLAAAAPDTLEPSPGLRDRVLAAAAARPRVAAPASSRAAAATPRPATVPGMGTLPPEGATRSGITLGPRRARAGAPGPAATPASSGPPIRWLLLSAAAAVVLFLAGAVLGGLLMGPPRGDPGATPRTAVASPGTPRGDPGRVLAEAALILQSGDHRLASLETPEGDAGGVVLVSGGTGRLAVVSSVLPAPPDGTRYVCLLDRSGARTQVGYMRWEPTSSGGGLAYWAGDAEPADLGMSGDVFIVQLDEADAEPSLIGEFLG